MAGGFTGLIGLKGFPSPKDAPSRTHGGTARNKGGELGVDG